MDKEKFGSFVSSLRKEKKYTQKELAEMLHLTDKAISKWERGLSFPDISLLEPLAEILEVSVLELLQGERLTKETSLSIDNAKEICQNSIDISDEEIKRKHDRHKTVLLIGCVCLMFLISLLLNVKNYVSQLEEKNHTVTISKDVTAYETRKNADGTVVFAHPEKAISRLRRDYEKQSDDKQLKKYLIILENTLREEEMKK